MVLKLVVDILTDEFCGGMCQDKIVDNVLTVSVVSMAVVVLLLMRKNKNMVCNEIVDIIGIGSFSATANLMVRTETKIGNKTGNKLETELQKEIVVSTYLVMLVLCNRIRNSLESADLMLCYT